MPQGFPAFVSSNQQIIGTACVCELFLYGVTPTNDGKFEAVRKSSIKQPHVTIKDAYIDFTGTSFMYVCSNKEEQHIINSLFTEVKGLPMVENGTDGVHSFLEPEDDTSSTVTSHKTTTTFSMSDLMDSFHMFLLD